MCDIADDSTTVRLASVEEVLAAKAYICFVSFDCDSANGSTRKYQSRNCSEQRLSPHEVSYVINGQRLE